MPVQSSGPISLNDLHVEAGGTSGTLCSLNDQDIRDMIGKASGAQASLSEYYGASSTLFDTASDLPVYGRWRTTYGGTYGDADDFDADWYWRLRGRLNSTTESALMSNRMLDCTAGGTHDGVLLRVTWDIDMAVDGDHTSGGVQLHGINHSSNTPYTSGVLATQSTTSVPGFTIIGLTGSVPGGTHGTGNVNYTGTDTFSISNGNWVQLGLRGFTNPPNLSSIITYWNTFNINSLVVEVA